MNIIRVLSFGLDVHKRMSKQKLSSATFKSFARAVRFGSSKAEWVQLGYELGIIEADE